ncbi:J domain-containing protein [Candidatus Woesearchaeota archaeon]|nr:J domain-containing protein [Candidatus Woesearchaeota archaeon]
MTRLSIKGHEFIAAPIRDSFHRRAVMFQNNILRTLRKLDLTEDDVDIPLERVAMKKAPASASWYFEGYHLYYSYQAGAKFVDNLFVVSKVIELEVNALMHGKKTITEFIHEFSEDKDIEAQRKKAREILGVEPDSLDLDLINKKYKTLAKEFHPDTSTGDAEKFKAINRAHKILKRELQ